MSEIDKLEKYLKEKGINYDRKKSIVSVRDGEQIIVYNNGERIIVYDKNGIREWVAIFDFTSYGYEEGLLELRGTIVRHGYIFEGWLTAENIIKRLEETDNHRNR